MYLSQGYQLCTSPPNALTGIGFSLIIDIRGIPEIWVRHLGLALSGDTSKDTTRQALLLRTKGTATLSGS